MAMLENGQTCLEKRGMDERGEEIKRSDYSAENPYGPTHPDAISDGDPKGKGTGHGGHNDWLPDCTKPTNMIDYSNFDTFDGGGEYDIYGRNDVGGREKSVARSMYNYERPYGADLVNTIQNVADGQYYVGQTIKNL
jgi:hypothetical protein